MEMKPQPKRNGFATFSLVLAIAALASTLTMTIVIPIFLAILSIMLLSVGFLFLLSFPTPMQNSSIGQWSMTPTSK